VRESLALAILACVATTVAQAQESGTEIEFSGWSLSPEVNVDFVDHGTVLIFGASFVWKF